MKIIFNSEGILIKIWYAGYLAWGLPLHYSDPALKPFPQTVDRDRDRSGLKLSHLSVRKGTSFAAYGLAWGN